MTLKLNGSSSGYTEINATAAAGNNILTLPTQAGTIRTTGTPGAIVQVVNASVTDPQSVSISTAWADTNVTAAITPASASNKILVSMHVTGEGNADPALFFYRLTRAISGGATTEITAPSAGSRVRVMGVTGDQSPNATVTMGSFAIPNYYDAPSTTSAVTYKMQVYYEGAATWFLNRTVSDTDAAANKRGMSWVTLMEVAG